MKVAELYASLGIQADKNEFRRALNEVKTFGRNASKALKDAWSGKIGRNEMGQFTKRGGGMRRAISGAMGSMMGGSGRIGNRAVGGVRSFAGGMMGGILPVMGAAAAGAGIVGLAKDAMAFDKQLTAMDVASQGAVGNLDDYRKKVLEVSKATGVAKEALVSGASSFVALTGDGKAAREGMMTFARVAKATGADMGEIAGAAASLSQQLAIKPEEMEKAFSILIQGGKQGAVELKDFAGLLPSLGAQFKQFGIQGTEGVAQLGAAFQIARTDFGSAAETATGLQALFQSLQSKRTVDRLREAGIDPFVKDLKTGEMRLRNFHEIMQDIFNSKLVQDPTKLSTAFGREEAVKALRALQNNRDGWFQMQRATMGATDVAKDYARVQQSASAKMELALNVLKVRVAEIFTPQRVAEMAKAMETLVGWTVKFINAMEGVSNKLMLGEKISRPKRWLLDLPGAQFAYKNIPGYKESLNKDEQAYLEGKIEGSPQYIKDQQDAEAARVSNRRAMLQRYAKKNPAHAAQLAREYGIDMTGGTVTTVNIYAQSKAGVTAEQIAKEVKRSIDTERRKVTP